MNNTKLQARTSDIGDSRAVKGTVTLVEAADGKRVFSGDYEVKSNGIAEADRVAWDGQGLFLIEYTALGRTWRTHYLHGEPPFKWDDYSRWTKDMVQ